MGPHLVDLKISHKNKVKKTFADGNSYFGELKNGNPNGAGVYKWHHGGKYLGQFKNGK